MKNYIFFILLSALLFSCAGGPEEIPDELTAMELIQRGQEASDKNRYGLSLRYYQALLERNRTNSTLVCTAEYEIAFIHYKEKNYDQARDEFEALLERYEEEDAETLPPEYRILANIVLKQIDEKQNAKLINFSRLNKKSG
jgi:outer membrane protein assembly factor BamD (BamD/ComL family)